MPPQAVLIAGANGAGKTTFARQFLAVLHPDVPFLNVDEIQLEGPPFTEPIAASKEFLRRLQDAETSGRDFAIETTLASRTYIPRVRRWESLGYRTVLHFIEVRSADFAVARVAGRVAAGGHDIPELAIRRRFARGKRLFHDVYQSLVPEWYHWRSDEHGVHFVSAQRN